MQDTAVAHVVVAHDQDQSARRAGMAGNGEQGRGVSISVGYLKQLHYTSA